MGARGPDGASAATLKLHGTYKPSKHRGRTASPQMGGVPKCPRRLKGEARLHWNVIVPPLIKAGVVVEIDGPSLIALCEIYALTRDTHIIVEADPTDDEARKAYLTFSAAYLRLAGKFGLTPRDRQAVRVAEKEDEEHRPKVSEFTRNRDCSLDRDQV